MDHLMVQMLEPKPGLILVGSGSFNFSLSAEHNAANALLIRDAKLADSYRQYVEMSVKRYG
jgi:hypothetical protein